MMCNTLIINVSYKLWNGLSGIAAQQGRNTGTFTALSKSEQKSIIFKQPAFAD